MPKLQKILLFLEEYDYGLVRLLQNSGYDVQDSKFLLNSNLDAVIGVFTKVDQRIHRDLIESIPNLRYVVIPATGTDTIDKLALRRRSIRLISLRDSASPIDSFRSTTEIFLWLLISMYRRSFEAAIDVQESKWRRNQFIGTNIAGKTIGIVGVGRLGRQAAMVCDSLGMRTLGYDTNTQPPHPYPIPMANSLHELAQEVDVISLHVDDRESNKHLIDRFFLERCQNVLLINTSRGMMIDEDAVLEALRRGNLSGYAADVLSGEGGGLGWLEKNEIWRGMTEEHLNILLTPHIGGATRENIFSAERFVVERFLDLEGVHGPN